MAVTSKSILGQRRIRVALIMVGGKTVMVMVDVVEDGCGGVVGDVQDDCSDGGRC